MTNGELRMANGEWDKLVNEPIIITNDEWRITNGEWDKLVNEPIGKSLVSG